MNKPEHEKLFDEICSKLNELSSNANGGFQQEHKFEKIQTQIKKFQSDLSDTSTELNEKIKSLEQVSYVQTDFSTQLKQINDQLTFERSVNTKLSTDLAKSLELCLQLQLEIQNIKTKAVAIQNEERKYSQGLLEKSKNLLNDLELSRALNEDLKQELEKHKEMMKRNQEDITRLNDEKAEILNANSELLANVNSKEQQIEGLNRDLEELSTSVNSMEVSSRKQSEALKNLMSVAESKMIELKLALDKKTLESQDLQSQLQQAHSQVTLFKQENIALKDYINKLTVYQQEMQKMFQMEAQKNFQAAAAASAAAPAKDIPLSQ